MCNKEAVTKMLEETHTAYIENGGFSNDGLDWIFSTCGFYAEGLALLMFSGNASIPEPEMSITPDLELKIEFKNADKYMSVVVNRYCNLEISDVTDEEDAEDALLCHDRTGELSIDDTHVWLMIKAKIDAVFA